MSSQIPDLPTQWLQYTFHRWLPEVVTKVSCFGVLEIRCLKRKMSKIKKKKQKCSHKTLYIKESDVGLGTTSMVGPKRLVGENVQSCSSASSA